MEAVETRDAGPVARLACRPATNGEAASVDLAIADIGEARLSLTEDLIRATLRREKAAIKTTRRQTNRRQKTEDRGQRKTNG